LEIFKGLALFGVNYDQTPKFRTETVKCSVLRKGLAGLSPTSVQKNYFTPSNAERSVLELLQLPYQ
jgi:hypothetical protein